MILDTIMVSRRFVLRVIPVLLALLGAPACDDSSPISPSDLTVVAFGDSITAGVGTTGDNDYVERLSDRTGVSIINEGRSGDTTGSGLSRLDGAVLSRSPDIVIVFLGGNDLLQSVPVQNRIANITAIVERIRAGGAAVILVGVGNGVLDPFNGALPAIAAQTGSTLVPAVLEGILGVSSLMADLIHPNNAGHAIIADRIEPALRAALSAAGS
jgi:lysophospholipase L1-like esterase